MTQIYRKEGWDLNPSDKIVNSVLKRIEICGGECPCANPGRTKEDRMCPCKSYREHDVCHCTLYVKCNKV
jgi:ferredoxin-thioredoxin reductase catalytic subunit